MVLVIDNYDSFTYNLVQYLGELGRTCACVRNDSVTLDEIAALPRRRTSSSRRARAARRRRAITHGRDSSARPDDADSRRLPGASGDRRGVRRRGRPRAGADARQDVDDRARRPRRVRRASTSPFVASRYHSLVVADDGLPRSSRSTARTREDDVIMGLRHRTLADARRPVPSRVDPDGRGPADPAQLPRGRGLRLMFAAADREADAPRGPDRRRGRGRDGRGHGGPGGAGADRRAARRAGDEGRAAGGNRRPRARRCARTRCSCRRRYDGRVRHLRHGRRSRRHVQHLVRARRSWWRRAACASPSTATARCRAGPAAPTCSRRSASTIAAPPAVVERCLDEAGIGFFFAPTFHPSMRHAAPTRRELGVRTAFNLLGPLTNPAGATRQLVGVPRPELTELLARALLLLGSERAWVVHGADGIDEISTTGYTKVSECRRRRGEHVLPAPGATSACRRRRRRR